MSKIENNKDILNEEREESFKDTTESVEEATYREVEFEDGIEEDGYGNKTEDTFEKDEGVNYHTETNDKTGIMSRNDENNFSAVMWLSSLVGFFTFLGFAIPIIMWVIKKDESEFVNKNGIEIINVFISYALYSVVASLLMIILIGFLILPVLMLMAFIFFIIGGVKASQGEVYRTPFTIRFIK